MFGFVIASFSQVSEEERARYNEVYCGLCQSLKARYGQISRTCLTYDLTFLTLLLNSLHEPQEAKGAARCPSHPVKPRAYARSPYSDYAADLTVAFAYHKCLDDWNDERKATAKVGQHVLADAYAQAHARIPRACEIIEQRMAEITAIERAQDFDPDAAANAFGALLGELLALDQGFWADSMREFGSALGRFIYLMDAAVDYEDDQQSGSYNPFVTLGSTPENMKSLLTVIAGQASTAFEKLPLEQDLHLMRSVLYAGIWQQFNKRYEQKELHD